MVEPRTDPRQIHRSSALAAAHEELVARCEFADRTGDWQEHEILSSLTNVADYVKRIGDHTDSTHYRAEKAGALLQNAIRLQREALLGHCSWPEDTEDKRAVLAIAELLADLTSHLQAAMWRVARRTRSDSHALYVSDARQLRAVATRLFRWVDDQAAAAEPDPVE